jgi:hypothetical protein
MKLECMLLIRGDNVGTIHGLHLDWPHWLGDFEPNPLFAAYQNIFAGIEICSTARRYAERDLHWERLFDLGVEIRSLDNELLFKRKGTENPKDIAILFIHNNGISFRIYNGEQLGAKAVGHSGRGGVNGLEKPFKLNIGGVTVGVIENLKFDWPRFLGDFHPNSEFQSVAEIFSKMNESQGEQRKEQLMRVFKMGIAIVDSDGSIVVGRTGEADLLGEIVTISIDKGGISFRILGPGAIPRK